MIIKIIKKIIKHIDYSNSNKTPLGRWNNVGKSCDEILNKKINKKIRTKLRKIQLNKNYII